MPRKAALALVRGGYKPLAASWQEGAQTTQIKVLANNSCRSETRYSHDAPRRITPQNTNAHVGRKLAKHPRWWPADVASVVSEQLRS